MKRIDTGIKAEGDEWLESRLNDITSSDSSALFGLSPYSSYFELWHTKRYRLQSFTDTEPKRWGNRLESSIAYGLAADHGLIVTPFKEYLRLEGTQIGSSFDFLITGTTPQSPYREIFEELGEGLLEIKNIDRERYKHTWEKGEAPPHIEIQVQHQMAVSGKQWCLIGGLVGGNEGKIIFRRYDPEIFEAILFKSNLFWESIQEDRPPEPDFARDALAVIKQNSLAQNEFLNATSHPELEALAQSYVEKNKAAKQLKQELTILKAQIFKILGSHAGAFGETFKIKAGTTAQQPDTVITPDMVGKVIKGKSASRQCLVNLKGDPDVQSC